MGTLYNGRFLLVDAFLLFGCAILPKVILDKILKYASVRLAKILLNDQDVTDRQITFTDSGTSALVLALRMNGVEGGDEVYFSSNTCESVAEAVISSGGVPVFLNVAADGSTDLTSVDVGINRGRKRVLILTNTYGLPEDIDAAKKVAEQLELVVINDLAQLNILTTTFARACRESKISVVSFGPEKYLAGLGGGAVIYSKDFSPSSLAASQRRSAVYSIFLRRVKYYLTFTVFGTALYPTFRSLGVVSDIKSKKDTDISKIRDTVEPVLPSPVLLLSALIRALFFRRRQEKEKRLYLLLCRRVDQRSFVRATNADYVPPALLIKGRVNNRFFLAERLAQEKFQTTWNYIPLYMLRPFRKYRAANHSDLWRIVLQVPFRFLSEKRINKLADTINDAI